MKENYFSRNIVALRKQRNLTTSLVAQVVKVTEETIVSWELGMSEPQVKDIMKIAKFYNVDSSDLVNIPLYSVKQERKNTRQTNESKTSKKFITLQAIVLALTVITLISFAFDCFSVSVFGYSATTTFFDMLTPDNFSIYNLLCWLILLFVFV